MKHPPFGRICLERFPSNEQEKLSRTTSALACRTRTNFAFRCHGFSFHLYTLLVDIDTTQRSGWGGGDIVIKTGVAAMFFKQHLGTVVVQIQTISLVLSICLAKFFFLKRGQSCLRMCSFEIRLGPFLFWQSFDGRFLQKVIRILGVI